MHEHETLQQEGFIQMCKTLIMTYEKLLKFLIEIF